MPTVNKQSCPTCGQSVNEREIALYSGMLDALWVIVKWCVSNGVNEFTRKDIKHLLTSDGQIARFGDWPLFTDMVQKNGKGHYILDKSMVRAFFEGDLEISIRISKDPLTKQINVLETGTIHDIPTINKFLDSNGDYVARYGRRHG